MTGHRLSRHERIAEVKGLYERLACRKLRLDDVLLSSNARYSKQGEFIRRIHKDQATFDEYFSTFHPTYDVFRFFGPADIVLDVGANWGYSAMAMRRQGCRARILSVEAMEANILDLRVLKELEAGCYDFIQAAATDVETSVVFLVPAVNGYANTGSSLTGAKLTEHFAYILADLVTTFPPEDGGLDRFQLIEHTLQGRRIDEVTRSLSIDSRVRAIKMDVEGHEALALRGAGELIARQRPLIMVEGANRDTLVVQELSGKDTLTLSGVKLGLFVTMIRPKQMMASGSMAVRSHAGKKAA